MRTFAAGLGAASDDGDEAVEGPFPYGAGTSADARESELLLEAMARA